VGHFNRRYFFNFCLWTTLGCGYFSLTAYPYLRWAEWPSRRIYRRFDSAFWLCTLITLALGALTGYHFILISKDQTTLEVSTSQLLKIFLYKNFSACARRKLLPLSDATLRTGSSFTISVPMPIFLPDFLFLQLTCPSIAAFKIKCAM
jgi:hypothetical protein